jgi:hypothetical protein
MVLPRFYSINTTLPKTHLKINLNGKGDAGKKVSIVAFGSL